MKLILSLSIIATCMTCCASPFKDLFGITLRDQPDLSQYKKISEYKYEFTPTKAPKGFQKFYFLITPESKRVCYIEGEQSSGGNAKRILSLVKNLEKTYKVSMSSLRPNEDEDIKIHYIDNIKKGDKTASLSVVLYNSGAIAVNMLDKSRDTDQEYENLSKKVAAKEAAEEEKQSEVSNEEGLQSWLGIKLGTPIDVQKDPRFVAKDAANGRYIFTPTTPFRGYENVEVMITPLSKIPWSICCWKEFRYNSAANAEYVSICDIIMHKFMSPPGKVTTVSLPDLEYKWTFKKQRYGYDRKVSIRLFSATPDDNASVYISVIDEDADKLRKLEFKKMDMDAL